VLGDDGTAMHDDERARIGQPAPPDRGACLLHAGVQGNPIDVCTARVLGPSQSGPRHSGGLRRQRNQGAAGCRREQNERQQ